MDLLSFLSLQSCSGRHFGCTFLLHSSQVITFFSFCRFRRHTSHRVFFFIFVFPFLFLFSWISIISNNSALQLLLSQSIYSFYYYRFLNFICSSSILMWRESTACSCNRLFYFSFSNYLSSKCFLFCYSTKFCWTYLAISST